MSLLDTVKGFLGGDKKSKVKLDALKDGKLDLNDLDVNQDGKTDLTDLEAVNNKIPKLSKKK